MEKKYSVLMSVYFKENATYLNESLKSVFNQTIKPDEVILIEDGVLTPELDEVITKYKNKYKNIFKSIKYEKNRGLGVALRDGLLKCSNEIVFRMDTDDICTKNRFEKQLQVFEEKNVDVVGTNITEFDEDMKNITGIRVVKENSDDIKRMAKKRNPINHMTVGFKKSKVINSGNYESMLYFEDYYLWVRMIKKGYKFYNIQENLVNVRGGNSMIKRRGGIKYIRSIVTFEKTLLKMKFINLFEFFINISERIFFSIVPNNFRATLYKNVLRK